MLPYVINTPCTLIHFTFVDFQYKTNEKKDNMEKNANAVNNEKLKLILSESIPNKGPIPANISLITRLLTDSTVALISLAVY